MESNTDPNKRFEDSTRAFLQAWQDMDKFDKRIGNRTPTTGESIEGAFRFGNMLVRMLIAFRDGDNWLRGH